MKNELVKNAELALRGKTIVKVGYLSEHDAHKLGFFKRPVFFVLNDGTIFYPSADDEGNDGGSLHFFKAGQFDVLPTI